MCYRDGQLHSRPQARSTKVNTNSAPYAASNRARILSNYVRLLTTFIAGLLTVRLLAEIGASSLSVYLIVIAGTGFAFFLKIVMQESIVPLLGLSYDGRENRDFQATYWVSFLFALAASAFAVIIFGIVWVLRYQFDIGDLPLATFGLALLSGAVRTVISSLATPPLQAVLITGRIVPYNIALSLERLSDLAAAVLVWWVLAAQPEAVQANTFFVVSAALYVFVQFGVWVYAKGIDQRFGFHPSAIERRDLGWSGQIFGWNLAIVVAFLLYLRFSTLIVNANYGEGPTLVLGLVFLMIGYQRQISMGLVVGLDAMVARLFGGSSNAKSKLAETQKVVLQSSHFQAVFSFGSVIVLWLLAEPIFRYWLGNSLDQSGWDVSTAADIFRIMSVGVLARSLSESWMKILNGRGLVGKYAPYLLAGGSIFACLLVFWTFTDVEQDQLLRQIAIAFTCLYVFVHVGIVPEMLCRKTNTTRLALLKSVAIPGTVLLLGAATIYVLSNEYLAAAGTLVICVLLMLVHVAMDRKRAQ